MDLQAAFNEGFEAVKAYVDQSFSEFENRLKALEDRKPEKGDPGKDGDDVDPEIIASLLHEAVTSKFSEISVLHDQLVESCKSRIEKAISEMPEPKPGKDGQDGKSFTLECAKPVISAAIEEIKKAIPEPKNPVDLIAASIERNGHLVLTLSNGRHKDLGLVVGKDGDPGKDGIDGFSLEDFSAEISDDFKTVTLKFERGEIRKTAEFIIPTIIYREIYREGDTYECGDCVTWGGSMWIAIKETTGKPGISDDWKLAVKRGRNGKEPGSGR